MTPPPEGWPTKAKEAPSAHEVRTEPAGNQPSMSMSREKTIGNPILMIDNRWHGIHPCCWSTFFRFCCAIESRVADT